MNSITLIGRLTKDSKATYTKNNTATCNFTLAVDRAFKNANGEREADFINCVIWRKAAENFTKFTHKGSRVGIQGRLQTRNYQNQQGDTVYVTEVVVENFDLLDPRNGNQSQQPMQRQPQPQQPSMPTQQNWQQPAPAEPEISDSDLPF